MNILHTTFSTLKTGIDTLKMFPNAFCEPYGKDKADVPCDSIWFTTL